MELQPDALPAPAPSDSRDWSDLPQVALTSILAGLGAVDVLMGAGLVCHSWLEAAKTPELWREVDMGRGPRDRKVMDMDGDIDLDLSSQGLFASRMLPRQPNDHYTGENREVMCAMAKAAVDRSDGKLEGFVGAHFITDEILDYIGARSPSLKRLALVSCEEVSCDGFTDLVNKCPLLEDIELSGCKHVGGHGMVAAGRACPRLRRLVMNKPWRRRWDRWDAAGISTMRELWHLRISRSEIRNEELMAVVDGCPFLQHLSVAECPNIVVDDALRAKCATVKMLELPASRDLDDLDAYEYGSLSYYVHVDNDWMSDPGWMA